MVLLVIGLMSAMSVAWLHGGPTAERQALEQLATHARAQAARVEHGGALRGLRWNGKQPEFMQLQVENGQAEWRREASPLKSWPEQLRPDWPVTAEPHVVFTPWGLARTASVDWQWPTGRERWHWRLDGTLKIVDTP